MINKVYVLVLIFETQCAVLTAHLSPCQPCFRSSMTTSHGGHVERAVPQLLLPLAPLPLPSLSYCRGLDLQGLWAPSQAILIRSHAIPPPRPATSCCRVSSPLLTHLCLDALGLPDVSDGFQEATLSFCLCHHQTRQFISQVFQATPEPTGLLTGLARKDRGVTAPGHFGKRLVEAGVGGAQRDKSATDLRYSP